MARILIRSMATEQNDDDDENECKKIQFIHMLTATDLRTSKTAKIKKVILLYHCTSSYVNVQQYSKIMFLFLLFSMCEGLSPLTCV